MNRQPNVNNRPERNANRPEAATIKPGAPTVAQPPPQTWGASPKPATTPPNTGPILSEDAIAKRAYEKFLARGGQHGQHEDDWEVARQELLAEAANPAAASARTPSKVKNIGTVPSEQLEEHARTHVTDQEVGGGGGGD